MNKEDRVKLCNTANRIKKMLSEGDYAISEWPLSSGGNALFIHKRMLPPSEGVYIQAL